MKRFHILVCAILFFSFVSTAQQMTISDSLKYQLIKLQAQAYSPQRDSGIVRTQYQLAWKLKTSDFDTSMVLIQQCISLSEKMNWHKSVANAKYVKANLLQDVGDYKQSNILLTEHISYYQSLINSDDKSVRKSAIFSINLGNNTMANNYSYLGEYEKAIQIHLDLLRFYESIRDEIAISTTNLNIAIVYGMKQDYSQSLIYSQKANDNFKKLTDSIGISSSYCNIANALTELKKTDEAIVNFQKALMIDKALNNNFGIVRSLNGIGNCYTKKREYQNALNNLLEANELVSNSGNQSSVVNNYSQIGTCYLKLGNYNQAGTWLLKSLEKVNENTEQNIKAALFSSLSDYYSVIKDYSNAYKYEFLYSQIQDTVHNEEVTRQLAETKSKYEYELKENKLNSAHEKELYKKEQLLSLNKIESEKKQTQIELMSQQEKLKKLEAEKLEAEIHSQKLTNDNISAQNTLLSKENEFKSMQSAKENQQKNFALVCSAILLIFGVYTFLLYKKRKKLSERLSQSLVDLKQAQNLLIQSEKEKEAENIRLRISRDIHDDIGHNLTKIALLSGISAHDKNINNPETKETLNKIGDYSRQVNSSLSEIVWAISPKQDNLESLLVYMRSHIHKFFENTNIKYQLNFPESIEFRSINPNLKRNIFLVLKESLNNILKYAGASNVYINFKTEKDTFELVVKDDGKGFDILDRTVSGNGLVNMKYRIEQSNGSFFIESKPGSGCSVTIQGNF